MPHVDCTAEQNAVNAASQAVVNKQAEIAVLEAQLSAAEAELTGLIAQLQQALAALQACQQQGHSGGG